MMVITPMIARMATTFTMMIMKLVMMMMMMGEITVSSAVSFEGEPPRGRETIHSEPSSLPANANIRSHERCSSEDKGGEIEQ